MERLISDAAALSDTVDDQSMSFSNIVEAIHVVQTEMGITGTTALEAGQTISGSVSSMKAAWQNLLTGLATGNADIEKQVDALITAIVGDGTEKNLGVIGNILPAIETALNGAGKLIDKALPIIIDKIPSFIEKYLPKILAAGVSIVLELAIGLVQAIPSLVRTIPQIISSIVDAFASKSDEFLNIGKNIVDGLKNGISNAWNNLVSWFEGLFGDLVGIAKQILGIASPSKVFKELGGWTAEGFGLGFEGKFKDIKKQIEGSLNFEDASVDVKVGKYDSFFEDGESKHRGFSVIQNIYSKAQTAADLMEEAMYQQERAVYLGV